MGNAMTVTALGKLFMNNGAVGLPMTTLALRNLAMLGMALGAGKCRMLCHIILQQFICLFMTAGAHLFGFVGGI